MPDFDAAIRKLARLSEDTPHERVYVIRQVLDKVHRQGYDDGYREAMQDRATADLIADADARDSAEAERTRIAAHFADMTVTREWRRRFEDRHTEHLGNGVTVRGLLSAVADEIKGMARDTR